MARRDRPEQVSALHTATLRTYILHILDRFAIGIESWVALKAVFVGLLVGHCEGEDGLSTALDLTHVRLYHNSYDSLARFKRGELCPVSGFQMRAS